MSDEELVTKLENFLFNTDMSMKARHILSKAYNELVAISDFGIEIHEHGILGSSTLQFINGESDYICNPNSNNTDQMTQDMINKIMTNIGCAKPIEDKENKV